MFNNIYKCSHICLYDYLPSYKYEKRGDLISHHKKLIQNCDLIILQAIRKSNVNIIHHNYIKSIIKPNCKCILIPHYTFSGYYYPLNILDDNNINENIPKTQLQNYIETILFDKQEQIVEHLNNELEHIKILDKDSDIECYDFIKNNYKKNLLFYSRSYPTSILFHYIAQEILKLLNIKDIIKHIPTSYSIHSQQPIYPNVKKYLNLQFNIRFNCGANLLEHLIYFKNNNNSFIKYKSDKQKIRSIIASGKYR